MKSAALQGNSSSIAPIDGVEIVEIVNHAQATENVSQDVQSTTVPSAAVMLEAASELSEQTCKLELDEKPKFKIIRDNCVPSSLQKIGAEGKKKQKTKWLLFDCDNTLVLSETLAFTASFDLVNEVLEYKGIDHRYVRDEVLIHFMGLSFSGMCRRMAKQFDFEWTAEDKIHFEKREEEEVIKLLQNDLKPLPGIMQVFVRIVREMKYNIAVVSSSSYPRIYAALEKTKLRMFFLDQYVFSAKSCLKNKTCKPDPAIYLHALDKLGVDPQDCVSVEDSRAGVMAAVRAGIPCIGFLGSYHSRGMQDQLCVDFHKDGCAAIMWEWAQFFDILNSLQDL